jgi:hypothetical protein
MSKTFQLSLASQNLWQAINPWSFHQQGTQFGFVNIDLGQTPQPEVEQAVLEKVGSYGRQLGRIGDALTVLRGQLAEIRQVKQAVQAPPAATARGVRSSPNDVTASFSKQTE